MALRQDCKEKGKRMSKEITVVLGASDPEMETIEKLSHSVGVDVVYATSSGTRVRPHTAYQADPPPTAGRVVAVECGGDWSADEVIDHHCPGDPGYGAPPEKFLRASSIGQFISLLAREGLVPHHWSRFSAPVESPLGWVFYYLPSGRSLTHGVVVDEGSAPDSARVPDEIVLAAAADHCPAAAYRGYCPGVSPAALARWRASKRAAYQGRDENEVLADVEAAQEIIRQAPFAAGLGARDLRGRGVGFIPELPEAALRLGECVIAEVPPPRGEGGLAKVVLQGAGEGTAAGRRPIERFLGGWAEKEGYRNLYGDPARGFAGGLR
jgi:hypothetical protein